LEALSVNVSLPVLAPVTVGVKVTSTVQEASPPRDEGHVVEATANAALLVRMLLMVRATLWLFVRVTGMGPLVSPTGRAAKVKLAGDTVTGAMPVPDRGAFCGLLAALSVTVSFPLNVPVVAGEKAIGMVQLAPLASFAGLMGQVLPVACAKSPVTAILVMVRGAAWAFWSVAFWGALVVPSTV
jgi:hypothetical protein